jgi:hypothetical protein
MRRATAGSIAAAIVVTVLLGAGGAPAHAAVTEVKPVSWDVLGIGASGRTLRLQYTPGYGCNGTPLGPRTRVTETQDAVVIELFDLLDVPPPEIEPLPCPLIGLLPRPAFVTLAAPLAGRSIKGRIPFPGSTTPIGPPNHPPSAEEVGMRVPRVVGFSVWEARRIIWRSGFNVQIRRSQRSVARTQVVAQGPRGRLLPREVVRLHVAIAR